MGIFLMFKAYETQGRTCLFNLLGVVSNARLRAYFC